MPGKRLVVREFKLMSIVFPTSPVSPVHLRVWRFGVKWSECAFFPLFVPVSPLVSCGQCGQLEWDTVTVYSSSSLF